MEIIYTTTGIKVNEIEVSLEEITTNIRKRQEKEEDLVVFNISWGGGRHWDGASEDIVVTRDNSVKLKEMIMGVNVNFGEIAGKHSEIYGDIDEGDINISNNAASFLCNHPSGHDYDHSFLYNIMEQYVEDEDCTFTAEDVAELLKTKLD